MTDNIDNLLLRLEDAQREHADLHVLLGQTRTAVVALQAKAEELTAENKQLNTDLRIALSVQGANGFKLSLKQEWSDA